MDILYTVEEKYLQAIEELYYGELPKALHLFHEIIKADAAYARAYYRLGNLYQYEFKDYPSAGYYYQQCIAIDPAFPDVYEHYLKLLVTLNKHKMIAAIAEQAFGIAGVCQWQLHEVLGAYAETQQDFAKAQSHYEQAGLMSICSTAHQTFQEHVKRVRAKQQHKQPWVYAY
jgi:tetratricopeptide (TPR) repeat protein